MSVKPPIKPVPVNAPFRSPETIVVDPAADQVSCDGGGGALGHPVVWYSFGKSDVNECMYCDRVFVKSGIK